MAQTHRLVRNFSFGTIIGLASASLVFSSPAMAATVTPIATIQGSGSASSYTNKTLTTRGFVTATYSTGGFRGYYLQTEGTGGAVDLSKHTASDGIFVFSSSTAGLVSLGDYVEITGKVSEYFGLTEITVSATKDLTKLDASTATPPKPATVTYPGTDSLRESLEGMLIQPQGNYTVTDLYEANHYGEIGLAVGTTPLKAPTSVGAVGSAEYNRTIAANAAAAVTLDDGASTDYLYVSKSKELPYLSSAVTVGSAVTFTKPVILDYRSAPGKPGSWRFQPQSEVTYANEATTSATTFSDIRTAAPANVGGSIRLGTFNVLNYFPHTGDSRTGCTFFTDKDKNPITVDDSSAPGCGVRGAATKINFLRQEAKIVRAITALNADIVSLEEIENSAKLGFDRDYAIGVLVEALNAAAGGPVWKYIPSPTKRPTVDEEDFVRTGFIYKPAVVEPIGESVILTGSPAFDKAREPDAQAFKPIYGSNEEAFIVISNHFKSRRDKDATGDNVDMGEGAYSGDRTRQATALINFAADLETRFNTQKTFLVGDFNAQAKEKPVATIESAGYSNISEATGKSSYVFDGGVASLDYIFASPEAASLITGADIWNINSVESSAREYSRYNYNALNLFNAKTPYRSSDHDPLIVGLNCLRHTPPIIPPGRDGSTDK